MKAITAVCATGASVPAVLNGRVSRHHRDGENAEIQMYLSKLKDLVPYMPKNRKLSKLEIIQHVIDYICDLQSELETHPAINNFDAAAALNLNNEQNEQQYQLQQQQQQHQHQQQNQYYLNNSHHQTEMNTNHNEINNASSRVNYNINNNNNNSNASSLISSSSSSLSSPTVRQPLSDRPAPNTILSATHNNPLTSPVVVITGQTSIMNNLHHHTIADKESMDRSC